MYPSTLFATQLPFFDSPVELLWAVTLLLFALTLLLFTASAVARIRHWSADQLINTYRERHHPLIFDYLEGECTRQDIEEKFLGEGIEFSVFENIVFEMIENLEGEDIDKLKDLLLLPPIYNFHLEQLNSNDEVAYIKACNYYRYLDLVNEEVIDRLLTLLKSSNKMLAFSAASALMASSEVEVRENALSYIASVPSYSKMALLEMVYNFKNNHENQMEQEAAVLKNLIENREIPPVNAAILIEGSAEMGYQQMVSFFYDKLISEDERWNHPEVLKALLKAQGTYYNTEALPQVLEHVGSQYPEIRASAAFALGQFGDEASLQILYDLLQDPVFKVKYIAVKSLHKNGEIGEALLKDSFEIEQLNTKAIVDTL